MPLRNVCAVSLMFVAAAVSSYPVADAWQTRSTQMPTATDRYPPQSGQTNNSHFPEDKSGMNSSVHDRMEEQAAKARNSDRFKRIQSDTEKLLQLSTELKEEVSKSTKNEMSLDVIRKAAEVEKLAHDVKERMKG